MEFEAIISLGWRCTPAFQLQRKQIRKQAFPLDWLITAKFDSVIKLFETNFENFLDPVVDKTNKYRRGLVLKNSQYPGLIFRHENVIENKERMLRRVKRLQELLLSESRVLFIRLLKTRKSPFTRRMDSNKRTKILDQGHNFQKALEHHKLNPSILFLIEKGESPIPEPVYKQNNIEIVAARCWEAAGLFKEGKRPDLEKTWDLLLSRYV